MRELLVLQKEFLQESGLCLIEGNKEGRLIVRYRQDKYISIEVDSRTGRVRAYETKEDSKEGQGKLRYKHGK